MVRLSSISQFLHCPLLCGFLIEIYFDETSRRGLDCWSRPLLGTLPPPPRSLGITGLAGNSRQIRRSKELRYQNP
jgi:hypothetical protein